MNHQTMEQIRKEYQSKIEHLNQIVKQYEKDIHDQRKILQVS